MPALVRLQHCDEQTDHRGRRVELAATLALGGGELGQEILVDPSERVLVLLLLRPETDAAEDVDELAEAVLVEVR